MVKHVEPNLGFLLQLEPRPGFMVAEARQLERAIEDYAEAHGLDLGGSQLVQIVSAGARSLTVTDQVDFMDWLLDQPGISGVRVSTLTSKLDISDARSVWQAGAAHLSVCDLGVIGLTILYRARRITADLYLQILGGFMRPALVH
jgi:uncharacterized protein YggL (DUF469 family)